jgi:hypothetical protein
MLVYKCLHPLSVRKAADTADDLSGLDGDEHHRGSLIIRANNEPVAAGNLPFRPYGLVFVVLRQYVVNNVKRQGVTLSPADHALVLLKVADPNSRCDRLPHQSAFVRNASYDL